MNYHSDEWIMAGVQRHYDWLLQFYPAERIVGIFYIGSGNYGIDYEYSDVDTWAIIIPKKDEVIFETKHIENTIELIWVTDIVTYLNGALSSDSDYLTALFTNYSIINPRYIEVWNAVVEKRELLFANDRAYALDRLKDKANANFFDIQKPLSKKTYYQQLNLTIGLLCVNEQPYELIFHQPENWRQQMLDIKMGTYFQKADSLSCYQLTKAVNDLSLTPNQKQQNYELNAFISQIIDQCFLIYNKGAENEHSN